MSGRLQGRRALITGAATGMGRATAELFSRQGAEIVLFGLGGEALDDAAKASGGRAVHGDITEKADVNRAIDACDGQLDIVVNAAGLMILDEPETLTDETWEKSFAVNVTGSMMVCRAALPLLKKKGGAVVNIASVAATIAFPSIAVYSGTKSAVDRMTRVGAMEAGKLGYGVRVNCIYPGLIPTDMGLQLANDIVKIGLAPDVNAAVGSVVEQTPLGKLAEVSDIADAAVFLCSNEARFITGIGLPVDGGMGM